MVFVLPGSGDLGGVMVATGHTMVAPGDSQAGGHW